MKKRLTALIAVIMCLVLCFLSLASCDESGNTDDTTKTPEESTTETSPNEDSGEDEPIDSTVADGETNEEPDDSIVPDSSSDTTGDDTTQNTSDDSTDKAPDDTTSEIPDDTTETPEPHVHRYEDKVTAPTCTEKGYTTHTCSCGDSYKDNYVKETGHKSETWITEREATETEDGLRYKKCDVCNTRFGDESIPMISHRFTNYVYNNDATCTKDGTETAKCDDQGCDKTHTRTKVGSAKGHDHKTVVTEPTCTEKGYTTHTCTCGDSYVDTYVDAKGHSFGEWAETKAPTCTDAGEKKRSCTCGESETLSVDATGHDHKAVVTEPTCTEKGYTTHTCICGDSYVDTYVNTKGHSFTDGVCGVCGKIEYSQGLEYTLSDDETYYILSARGTFADTELIIPSSYKGLPVKAIKEDVFANCTSIKSVTIPDSITSIGRNAFYWCKGLTGVYITDIEAWCKIDFSSNPLSYAHNLYLNGELLTDLVIPDSITALDDNAFVQWTGLKSVTVPSSIKTIGQHAFADCTGLTDVYITDIGAWCEIYFTSNVSNPLNFADNLYINGQLVTDIVIPDGVTSICSMAFYGFTGIKSIKIPDSVTSIGSYAFKDCSALTSVSIPNGLTSIENGTFSWCTALESVKLPSNLKSIGYQAFGYCSGLTSITIPDSVTSIGNGAFSSCKGLKSVTLSAKITAIGISAFDNCTGLTSIEIPDGVTSIGNSAFSGCTGLIRVTIPGKVTSIGERAFQGCKGLVSVTIPNSLMSFGNDAFSYCDKLVEVIDQSKLSITAGSNSYGNIGYYALEVHKGESKIVNQDGYLFYSYGDVNYLLGYEGSETNLVLPDTYNGEKYEIYKYAFQNNVGLKSVTMSEGVTSIGYGAFYRCTNLASVKISGSVKSIETFAFYGCDGLTSITIPNSVTSIERHAFYSCENLTSVTFDGTKAEWGSVSKGSPWKNYVPFTVVHCTDGDVSV